MKICPCTPLLDNSSPSACSAPTISAREKRCGDFSDTVKHLPRDEHPVAREHGRSVGQHICLECRLAFHQPPRLDEATGVLDPVGCGDLPLARKKLRCTGQGGIEASVAGRWRLLL